MVNSPVTNSAIKPAQTGSQALNAQNQNSNVIARVSYNQTTTNNGAAENSRINQIATALPGMATGAALMPFNPLLGIGMAGMGIGSGLRNAWNNSGAEPARKENSNSASRGFDDSDDSSGGDSNYNGGGSNQVGANNHGAPGAQHTDGLFGKDSPESESIPSAEKSVAALDQSDSQSLQNSLNSLLPDDAKINQDSATGIKTEDGKELYRASSQNGNSTLLIFGAMNGSDREFLKANPQGLNVVNINGEQEKPMREMLNKIANPDLANSRVILIDTRKANDQTKETPSSIQGGSEVATVAEQAKENNAAVDSTIENTVTNVEKSETKSDK